MGIVLKHILKNIFGKPGRTLLIVTCITICSFVALFTCDLSSVLHNMIANMVTEYYGDADIEVLSSEEIDLSSEKYPETKSLAVYEIGNTVYLHSDRTYYLAGEVRDSICSFDFTKASEIGYADVEYEIHDGQCVINETYQKENNLEIGDKIQLRDLHDGFHDFEVVGITNRLSGDLNIGRTVIVTREDMNKLSFGNAEISTYIDVKDASKAKEVKSSIEEDYPSSEVRYFLEANENLEREESEIDRIFSLILIVCILMVIFVTISVTERVICERMAVVGTLRSLGFSRDATTIFLLMENVIYGLMGSLIGTVIFLLTRGPILYSMFFVMESTSDGRFVTEKIVGKANIFLIIFVILAAVLIECLCSVKEVVKAVKTPIRDIIFLNKDTKYEISKISVITGVSLIAISLISMFAFTYVYVVQLISLILMMAGLSLVAPCFFVFVGKRLSDFFEKRGKIIPALAARESYTKKNTIGASVLITTVFALCIVVINFFGSTMDEYKIMNAFTSDIKVNMSDNERRVKSISHLPGITDIEVLHTVEDEVIYNGKKYSIKVYGASESEEGYKYLCDLQGVRGNLSEDEMIISRKLANKWGIKEGGTYKLTFCSDEFIPIERELKVVEVADTSDMVVTINPELMKNIYGDSGYLQAFINCEDPQYIDSYLDSVSSLYSETQEEYLRSQMEEKSSINAAINAILIIGCGITFIGASGSLLIGFEARKRECAVLLSTSLTRKKLSFSFLLESFFASLWGIVFALPFGFLMTIPAVNVISEMDTSLELSFDVPGVIKVLVIMLIVFSCMCIMPINALKKMKLSEQLKYE